MKHVVLYVGHMYKPFWTKKIWPGWQGGSGKVKIGQNIAQNGPCFWLRSLLEAPKWVKDPWNGPKWSPQLPLIDLSPFLGSLSLASTSTKMMGIFFIGRVFRTHVGFVAFLENGFCCTIKMEYYFTWFLEFSYALIKFWPSQNFLMGSFDGDLLWIIWLLSNYTHNVPHKIVFSIQKSKSLC